MKPWPLLLVAYVVTTSTHTFLDDKVIRREIKGTGWACDQGPGINDHQKIDCSFMYDWAEALNEAHERRSETFEQIGNRAVEETNQELAPDIKRLMACPMCPGERK